MGKEWDRFIKGTRQDLGSIGKFFKKFYARAGDLYDGFWSAIRTLDNIADQPREKTVRTGFKIVRYGYNTRVVPAAECLANAAVSAGKGVGQSLDGAVEKTSAFLLCDVFQPFKSLGKKVADRAKLYRRFATDPNCYDILSLPEYLVFFALSGKERARYRDTIEAAVRGAM